MPVKFDISAKTLLACSLAPGASVAYQDPPQQVTYQLLIFHSPVGVRHQVRR
jgi:hypothetical protein